MIAEESVPAGTQQRCRDGALPRATGRPTRHDRRVPVDEELVELGGVVVRADRLSAQAAGIDDETLQEAIDCVHQEPGWEPIPRSGWRVLRDDGDSVVVGAYDDAVWHGWTTILLHRDGTGWRLGNSSLGQQPRPTAATRGHGLSLAFSEDRFVCRRGDTPQITVTLTNGSDHAFRETTSWCALGHLVDSRTDRPLPTEDHLALAAMGRDLVLAPGESEQFPVVLFTRDLPNLARGNYGVEVSFQDLALRVSGGQLIVE